MSDKPSDDDKPPVNEAKAEGTMGAMSIQATAVTDIMEWLSRIERGQGTLSNDLKAEIAASSALLRTDLMKRMDRLQESFEQTKSEAWVTFSNTERVDRRAQAAHDEIKALVNTVNE